MVGICNAQMARFEAISYEIYERMASFELSGKHIKEYETELEQHRGELQSLRSGQITTLIEVDHLKTE